MMKIWSTKYCLTMGILEHEVKDVGDGLVRVANTVQYLHGEGREWHRTYESAIARAEQMRRKKILALQKQIERLHALRF